MPLTTSTHVHTSSPATALRVRRTPLLSPPPPTHLAAASPLAHRDPAHSTRNGFSWRSHGTQQACSGEGWVWDCATRCAARRPNTPTRHSASSRRPSADGVHLLQHLWGGRPTHGPLVSVLAHALRNGSGLARLAQCHSRIVVCGVPHTTMRAHLQTHARSAFPPPTHRLGELAEPYWALKVQCCALRGTCIRVRRASPVA